METGMIITNKGKYRAYSEVEKTIPLFSKGWWMDAVCQDDWDVILIEENKQIIAALPYYIQNKYGEKEIRKAPLTQTNGVWISYPSDQKYEKKISYETNIMNLVINEIEKLNLKKYQQYFHYSVKNWLPFYWRGFTQTTRYTYVITDTSKTEEVYNNFNSNIRKNIRKAEKSMHIKDDLAIDEFYHLNKMIFNRQNIEIPYSFDTVLRIDEACVKRNARKIYYCTDEHNQIHSAAYFAWDDNSVYYLMSGSNPHYRSNQSLTLLLYEGIKLASALDRKFDFEGSMKENIERYFRQFGAQQIPYHNICKVF